MFDPGSILSDYVGRQVRWMKSPRAQVRYRDSDKSATHLERRQR